MEYFKQLVQIYYDALHKTLYISCPILIIALFLAFMILGNFQGNKLPPGPKGLPLFGYWPFLKDEIFHLQELKLKKKYGEIYSFNIMGKLMINLASFKVLRKAYVIKSDCFTERVKEYCLFGKMFKHTVFLLNGKEWKTIRKFFSQQFKERGMSVFTRKTNEIMNNSVTSLIEYLQENENKPVDIHLTLTENMKHVVRQTLFGIDTPITTYDIQAFQEDYKTLMTLMYPCKVILVGKRAWYFIMPFIKNFWRTLKAHTKMITFFLNSIEEHSRTFNSESIRDIIDSFLKEKYSREIRGDITAEYFTNEGLAGNLIQFVGDSTFSGATFISFFLKVLLDHPEEQEKIYNELTEVCGKNRNPEFSDRSKLPYTKAFFQEAQRFFIFIPTFPRVECTTETTINGYRIPKGAFLTVNVYAIHNDPQVYENPQKFDPSRFLEKDGKPSAPLPITFSMGKRTCPGESFIMMQVFMFCTTMVKNFRMTYSPSKSNYEILNIRQLKINFTPRK